MEDYIANLAAQEGWTDTTTVGVLADVLQRLIDIGCAERADLEALIRSRAGLDEDMS